MKKNPPVGKHLFVIAELIPDFEAGKAVEIISYEEFSKGNPVTTAKYTWSLPVFQKAIFAKILEGPKAGMVTMFSDPSLLLSKRPVSNH